MRWFRTLPMWAFVLLMFLLTGGLWYLLGLVTMPEGSLVGRLVGTVFYAGVMTVFFAVWAARARRQAGGAHELHRIQQATRRGEVPPGADVGAWTAAVEAQYRLLRRNLWMGPLVFISMLLLTAWLAITQASYWWFGVAFFAAFSVATFVSTPRTLRKVTRMRSELSRRAGAGADESVR